MDIWHWGLVILVVVAFVESLSRGKATERLQKRVLDLEVRLHKIQEHLGFVADPSPPVTDDVKVLARTPGSKIAAIKLYRQQTGAGLKDAKDAVERMMEGQDFR